MKIKRNSTVKDESTQASEKGIVELTSLINSLTLERDSLIGESATSDQEQGSIVENYRNPYNISSGDNIIVLSNYKGRQGVIGRLLSTTRCQRFIQTSRGNFSVNLTHLHHYNVDVN